MPQCCERQPAMSAESDDIKKNLARLRDASDNERGERDGGPQEQALEEAPRETVIEDAGKSSAGQRCDDGGDRGDPFSGH